MIAKLRSLLVAATLTAAPAGAAHREWPGELAVVSGGRLVLMGPGGTADMAGGGQPSEPAWSPDGRWVAFLRNGSALWVVRANGTGAHRVSAAGVEELAWSGTGRSERLVFSVGNASALSSKIALMSPWSGATRALGTYQDLIGFSAAPTGGELAVNYRADVSPNAPAWKSVLKIIPLAGGRARTVYTLPDGGYVTPTPGWWPDGKGLLFWDDPAGSASIAADGLPLDSLDLATGKVSTLATTLTYPNWVAWSPNGTKLAIVAGEDRVVWASGKHLVVCAMPEARCAPVALPGGNKRNEMALDPAWTPRGELVYDVAPGTASGAFLGPPGLKVVGDGPFDPATVDAWYARMRLYVGGHEVRGAGTGAHDPVAPGAAPGGLFFVKGSGLWYLPDDGGQAAELATGLASPGRDGAGNYYGYTAWYQDFAWHA